ncbi:MAG: hydrogenase expression/formation protein HypE [Neomegalonema sp.]|nr:hydrogenase expression/formation protein HypE [Neomegalonema sp.]
MRSLLELWPLSGERSMKGAVDMTHGGGGRASAELIRDLFQKHLGNELLNKGHDAAYISAPAGRLVTTVDAHVISPLFFPGGDIGALSVHGAVNDLAMAGALPLYLTAGFILEEGLPLADLDRIVSSMAAAAREAGAKIVAGDTKVVERGKGDGVFITTTAIGVAPAGVDISPEHARSGMKVLLSGSIGDHGVAVMSSRENLEFESEIVSDSASLHEMAAAILAAVPNVAVLRDPTRGGVATALNEIAAAAGVGFVLDEAAIPVKLGVRGACELLGLDPLYVANEGKMLCICPAEQADAALEAMRSHPCGAEAAIIGEAVREDAGMVRMRTEFGGVRVVDWLAGEQLPRIC